MINFPLLSHSVYPPIPHQDISPNPSFKFPFFLDRREAGAQIKGPFQPKKIRGEKSGKKKEIEMFSEHQTEKIIRREN